MKASEPKWVNHNGISYGVNSLRLGGLQIMYIILFILWQKHMINKLIAVQNHFLYQLSNHFKFTWTEPKWVNLNGISYGVNSLRLGGLQIMYNNVLKALNAKKKFSSIPIYSKLPFQLKTTSTHTF